MFTGIVEELGRVASIHLLPDSARLTVRAEKVLTDIRLGDSIAVNGVCLTAVDFRPGQFTADVMQETLRRTNLADLQTGSPVNLERALRLDSRLGGHLVSGHIDGTGLLRRIRTKGIAREIEFSVADPALLTAIIPKGSIALDGISLTVIDVGADYFSISLIPHTVQETTLGLKKIGDKVNVETDMIGKYVARLLNGEKAAKGASTSDPLSLQFLAERGFL